MSIPERIPGSPRSHPLPHALTVLGACLLTALALAGCGGGNTVENAADAIEARYAALSARIERRDLNAIMDLVSRDYLHDGQDREDFRFAFESLFAELDRISARFVVRDINFDSTRPEFADVSFDGIITGTNLRTGTLETRDVGGFMVWRRESGSWRMFGNQELIAGLKSQKRPSSVADVLGKKRDSQ